MIARTPHGALRRVLRTVVPVDGLLPTGHSLSPDIAVLVPTLRCNLHCPYCFQRDDNGIAWQPRHPGDLGIDEWEAVVTDLASIGAHVIVIGGELFLYRDALRLLRAVKRAGLSLTVITNGIFLPRVASDLLDLELDRLIVSLDGPPAVHNAVRGHPRGFQLATEGIAQILAQRKDRQHPFVQVSCTMSTYNQRHLVDLVNHIGPLGVDQIDLTGLIYTTAEQAEAQSDALRAVFGLETSHASVLAHGAQRDADVALLEQQLKAIRATPWSERVVVSPDGLEQHIGAYYASDAPRFRSQRCLAIHRELWILPNGDVSACGYITDLTMGNVRDGGWKKAWNGPSYRTFRQHLRRELLPACARCTKLSFRQAPSLSS